MTTLRFGTDITVTLSDRKADQYHRAVEASASLRRALASDEWGWSDLDDWWREAEEAWERFLS